MSANDITTTDKSSKEISLPDAQKILLEILEEVHKICVDNNLTYWLEGGTLLGAIRHNGFIPWDDDVDIAMPVEDLQKFKQIAPDLLSKQNFLQCTNTDPSYKLPIVKIRRNGTRLIEMTETGNEPYHHGIFVDIIPCERYKSSVVLLKLFSELRRIRSSRKRFGRNTIKRKLIGVATSVFNPILKLEKYFQTEGVKSKFCSSTGQYLSHSRDFGYVHPTKVNDILPVKLVENVFEGKSFYLPNNPHEYLKAYYNRDYMIPTVEEDRVFHHKVIEFEQ